MAQSSLLKPVIDQNYPVVAYGNGVFLYDTEGNKYLDGSSGAMTASIGHGVEEVAQTMRAQAERIAFSYRTQFTNKPAEDLARELVALAPDHLNWVFFVNSGSEASEFAIRAALGYWRDRGLPEKTKILGRHTSYHGMTMGALSMSGHPARRPDYGPLLHAFPVAPPVHSYRYARPDESECEYAERAVADFEQAIRNEDPQTVAAVIVEPIVGAAGGVLVPPDGYLRKLREVCDRLNVLLIVDEVITGVGRTGDWFACEHEGVVPDMLLVGKGLSGGYAPVGAVLMHEHLVETLRAHSGIAPFGHTFSANPLSMATCLTVLRLLQRESVLDNVRQRGAQLARGLRSLAERYHFVDDVRGRGLLWGFEFVTDRQKRETPDPEQQISAAFVDVCFREGLLVYPAGIAPFNNAAIISPPLRITECEIEILLEKLDLALAHMSGFFSTRGAKEDPPRPATLAYSEPGSGL